MNRIDTTTKAIDLYGVGKHGFKDGNIALGIAATDLNAKWFGSAQEELLSVIEAANLVPDSAQNNQVLTAINKMIGAAGLSRCTMVNDVLSLAAAPINASPYAFVCGYYSILDNGGPGFVYYDALDTSSIVDDVIVFGSNNGAGRWKRLNKAAISTRQAGCKANGVAYDDAAFSNWWKAIRSVDARGEISSGVHRFKLPVELNYNATLSVALQSDRTTGLQIEGSGLMASVLDLTAVQTGVPFLMTSDGTSMFYSGLRNFSVLTNINDVGSKLGLGSLADEFNGLDIDNVEFKNLSNTANAVACEINGFYKCDLDIFVNGGQTGRVAGALAKGLVINRMAFCTASLSCGNAATALEFAGSYTYGNTLTLDVEEADKGILFSGDRITHNHFLGGTILAQTCIKSTASNSFENKFSAGCNITTYAGGQVLDAARNGVRVDNGDQMISTPAFPASGVVLTNTTGQTALVIIYNGAPTQVTINGSAITVAPGGAGLTHVLEPGDTIAVNYTGGCAWVWRGGIF